MKQSEIAAKEALCRDIERLHREVNELALRLCACQTSETGQIWNSLANARAHLANALESSRHLKHADALTTVN
jgi:hypothetical protein